MNIVTVGVGQGAMSIIRHANEAIIVDSRIPPRDGATVAIVKEMLAVSLKDHFVKGLILTGFDDDHTDIVGASIILRKYRPDWVMYPRYYKGTREAKRVFALLDEEEKQRAGTATPLQRYSVRLDQLTKRILPGLSDNFDFELFSPHIEDMDCSNNCSIVVKVTGRGPRGFSYLVTGDTENSRWATIVRLFGGKLKSHVLAAPHHGSKNATHPAALVHIAPHTVLISAGVESQYGHPDANAVRAYKHIAKYVFSTNMEGGVSLLTQPGRDEIKTTLIPCALPEVAGSDQRSW
jgi:beta-lactamase superfamily II metal-dependent hydrolase